MSATVRQRDFEEYARAGRQRLYRTAHPLCGDREHARDLVRSTPARLFRHWHRASRAEHLDAYARTVLTRLFLHERRRRLRDLLAHARPDPAPAATNPSTAHPSTPEPFGAVPSSATDSSRTGSTNETGGSPR